MVAKVNEPLTSRGDLPRLLLQVGVIVVDFVVLVRVWWTFLEVRHHAGSEPDSVRKVCLAAAAYGSEWLKNNT